MNTLLTPAFRRDNRHSFSVAFFVIVMIDIRDGYWLLYQYKKQSNIKLDNQNFGNPYVDTKGAEHQPTFCSFSAAGKNAGDATNAAGINTQSISGNPEFIRDSNSGIFGHSRNQAEARDYQANRCGDEFVVQLKGIVALGVEIVTRVHNGP